MNTDPPSTRRVMARLITEAMIGPTQGVQISPRLAPTGRPLHSPASPDRSGTPPACCRPAAPRRATREASRSNSSCSFGTSMTAPKRPMKATATMRSASGDMPIAWTIAERVRVNTVKLTTNPASTPKGRAFPPPRLPDRTIGRTGRMQGERMVMIPDTKAKASRTAIAVRSFPGRPR